MPKLIGRIAFYVLAALVTMLIASVGINFLNAPSLAPIGYMLFALVFISWLCIIGYEVEQLHLAYRKWKIVDEFKKEVHNNRFGGPPAAAVLLIALIPLLTGCATRIDPGYAGIKVSLTGQQRGVQDYPIRTGRIWYNPWSSQVLQWPTFVQTAKWTHDPNEGHPTNEEITFTTKDQMVVSADISISYVLAQKCVPQFYVKFRTDDMDAFTHGFLRNLARDHFNEAGGKYTIEQVMGDNEPFIREVRQRLESSLEPICISIEQFGFIGAPRPPKGVVDAINSKVQATQLAFQKQNEVQQAQAEAAKDVAKAEGDSKAMIARAQGQAEANRLLAQSISPELIQWQQMEITKQAIARWNGVRPTIEGGSGQGFIFQMPLPGGKQ